MYEITIRCMQSRYLLRTGKKENALYIGCAVKALAVVNSSRDVVRLHLGGGLSNHLHLIVSTQNLDALALFKSHFFGNLSKEIGHLHKWPRHLFDRRSRTILILPDALDDRLMYLLVHGFKEGLTRRGKWPGVPWIQAVTEGAVLKGIWIDRTAFYHANRAHRRHKSKSRRPKLEMFTTEKTLELHALPGWEERSETERRAHWADMVERAHRKHALAPGSTPPLGAAKILKTDPQHRPEKTKRSPAPLVHTLDADVRRAWIKKYREFVASYREGLRAMVANGVVAWCECFAQGVTPVGLAQRG
jgi:hypothetical protein